MSRDGRCIFMFPTMISVQDPAARSRLLLVIVTESCPAR